MYYHFVDEAVGLGPKCCITRYFEEKFPSSVSLAANFLLSLHKIPLSNFPFTRGIYRKPFNENIYNNREKIPC